MVVCVRGCKEKGDANTRPGPIANLGRTPQKGSEGGKGYGRCVEAARNKGVGAIPRSPPPFSLALSSHTLSLFLTLRLQVLVQLSSCKIRADATVTPALVLPEGPQKERMVAGFSGPP